MRKLICLVSILFCVVVAKAQPVAGSTITTEKQKFVLESITTELQRPWGMAFLPDGRAMVTEKDGEIRIIKDGKLLEEKISGVPEVFNNGQGGLLDIQLHPDYAKNGWIYISYAKPDGTKGGATTIARVKLQGNAFTNVEELFMAQPSSPSGAHFGSRIVFDGKGYIFFSCGERGKMENAQDITNHLGKIMRLHDDGRVPKDNPFVNKVGAKPEIWSYGHRNPQGLYYDKATSTLWDGEHGPKGGDELNKVEKGKNYGWPVITYGINYDDKPITDITKKDGMEQPVRYWVPSIAPCGMTMVTSDKYPNWKGNFLVGALSFQLVARVEVANGKFVAEERILEKIGRVRHVVQSPDGYIYVLTENPGTISKLVPVK
ncbi:MAG: PQQ-dependent sugar dehydrogenase [Cyclobacteriaceae bacterium]|nr:PQQ-dependent sugar dehydrogenase [Cyclobacteriaceae bacterium]